MTNENIESKKVILGMMVGAFVGATALYFAHKAQERRTPILHKVGRTLIEVGDLLENSHLENLSNVVHDVQKSFPKSSDFMSGLYNCLSTGMNLWQKIKNGG